MTRNIGGCHAPNNGNDPNDGHPYWDGWGKMLAIAGQTGSITMLHLSIEHYPDIRRVGGPLLKINLRMYNQALGGAWCDVDPAWYAQQCYDFIRASQPAMLDDPLVVVGFRNEPDLAVEGYGGGAYVDGTGRRDNIALADVDYMHQWEVQCLTAARRIWGSSPNRFGCLAWAGGHEPPNTPPDYEFTRPLCREVVALADETWGHAYVRDNYAGTTLDAQEWWHSLRLIRPAGYRERVQGLPPVGGIPDPGGLFAQYRDKPGAITEAGNGHHSDPLWTAITVAQERAMRVTYRGIATGITRFLWDSGGEHGSQRINRNPDLVTALMSMEQIAAADWPPSGGTTMDEATQNAMIAMIAAQNALLTRALVAIREGRWTGADSVDGLIVALNGGKLPDGYRPVFPPK